MDKNVVLPFYFGLLFIAVIFNFINISEYVSCTIPFYWMYTTGTHPNEAASTTKRSCDVNHASAIFSMVVTTTIKLLMVYSTMIGLKIIVSINKTAGNNYHS